jgi:hypothetical protein
LTHAESVKGELPVGSEDGAEMKGDVDRNAPALRLSAAAGRPNVLGAKEMPLGCKTSAKAEKPSAAEPDSAKPAPALAPLELAVTSAEARRGSQPCAAETKEAVSGHELQDVAAPP